MWRATFLALLAVVFATRSVAVADEDTPAAEAKKRLNLMQSTIEGFEAESDKISREQRLQFAGKPLLRYSDPTRGLAGETVLLDASVWRLGESGRPTALVTLEIYRSPDQPDTMSYEFLSFTPDPFSLRHTAAKEVAWDATGTDVKLAPLDKAPVPAKSSAGRLRQIRELARRFRVVETLHNEKIECRLMTQPIDRYSDADHSIVDGALVVFANGTNPEGGVLLECDKTGWSYATYRLGAAPLSFELDRKEVASYPFFGDYGRRDGAYASRSHPLEAPSK